MIMSGRIRKARGEAPTFPIPSPLLQSLSFYLCNVFIYLFIYFLWHASGIYVRSTFKLLAIFHLSFYSTVTRKLQKAGRKKNISYSK